MSTNKLKPAQIKAFKEKEVEVFKADEDEFNELSGSLANDSDDKENALKIVQLRCIPLIDEKNHHNRLSQSAQVVRTLIDLGEVQEDNEGTNFNLSIQIFKKV